MISNRECKTSILSRKRRKSCSTKMKFGPYEDKCTQKKFCILFHLTLEMRVRTVERYKKSVQTMKYFWKQSMKIAQNNQIAIDEGKTSSFELLKISNFWWTVCVNYSVFSPSHQTLIIKCSFANTSASSVSSTKRMRINQNH